MRGLIAIVGHLSLLAALGGAIAPAVKAQSITAAPDSTGTVVNQRSNTYTITGGTLIDANLFHSLQKFGLSSSEIATFVSRPNIQNILARVNGGEPSVINGLLQVTGGKANLVFVNPAGVIFGPNASVNVPAAFIVDPPVPLPLPLPGSLSLPLRPALPLLDNPLPPNPFQGYGSINRIVGSEELGLPNPTNLSSAIASPTALGQDPGQLPSRFNPSDSLLQLEIPAAIANAPQPWLLLPQTLTGGSSGHATTVIAQNGTLQLTGSGLGVNPTSTLGITPPTRPLGSALAVSPAATSAATCLDASILATEVALSQTYNSALGLPVGQTITVNACKVLNAMQATTGVNHVLLYVTFIPPALNASPEQAELELVLIAQAHRPVRHRIAAATRATLRQLAADLRNEITDPSKTDTTSYRPVAAQLYQLLIAPIAPNLIAQGTQHITFILDPELSPLPLAALYDRARQQFLIQQYSLSLMPSLSLTDQRYRDIRQTQVLAMGRSTFADPRQAPLPAVPLELALITQTLWSGQAFLNEQFTLENLKRQRQKSFGVIHLATHGEFKLMTFPPANGSPAPGLELAGSSVPMATSSYIQLWDTQLRLNQLRDLKLDDPPVDLLVLSACRTAVGDRHTTLGFAGLALQIGVKSILASLWSISDVGTLGLVTEFYQQLRTAPTKAEALRLAQIAMLRQQVKIQDGELFWTRGQTPLPPHLPPQADLSHPYYWAGFTLIGNPW